MSESLVIALAGNPNSGKTTMFNALTGARRHVGNYPGVTVERREGRMSVGSRRVNVVDLPGMYSLTAYSADELAARRFLVEEKPHVVIDVIDAGALERGLYLTVQLMELGAPMVLALNMMDEVKRRGLILNGARLAELLRCPVVETVARNGTGKENLINEAMRYALDNCGSWTPLEISYGRDIDEAILSMTRLIEKEGFLTGRYPARWLALKYLENDEDVIAMGRAAGALSATLEDIAAATAKHLADTAGSSPDAEISNYRYGFIASLLKQGVLRKDASLDSIRRSDKADRILTHPLFGPVIMLGALYLMFQATFILGEYPMGWLESFFEMLAEGAAAILPEGLLQSLVVSGVIGGVGGVLGFVPLIIIMFFLLTFLEDLGYMARMAYMLDRVFRAFGLHGGSVMPFIISGGIPGGCAVPGVMAARTLRSPKERLATILTAPFMSCGAKVPVFLLLAAAFFPRDGGMVLFVITLASWAAALVIARFLRGTFVRGESTPFIMELPPYRLPRFSGLCIHTWERAWQYIRKAGTVILAISILLWAAMTFPGLSEEKAASFESMRAEVEAQAQAKGVAADADEALSARLTDIGNLEAEEALRDSVAGRVGLALEGVSRLAGFDWRVNIALIGGLAAKEVVVSTLGTSYALGEVDPEEAGSLSEKLANDPAFSKMSAISLIIFTILYAPCFVTVAVMAKEASWKWAGFAVIFNTALGFFLAVAAYQLGTRLS